MPAAPPLAAPAPPRRGDAVLAFLGALVLLAAFAGIRDLWDADEGRYATVALDMLRAHDLVTPREHGMRFLDKPPLVYWMACGAFRLLGETPFAARLPCLVAGATLAALGFLFAARWTGARRAGFAAALVTATSAAGMGFSRTVTMDMALAAAVAAALYAGLVALARDGVGPRLALGASIGAGLLAKGPLAAVAPATVALAWAVVGVDVRRTLAIVFSPTAWVAALAVAGPWYALCEHANPGYLAHFLVYEHFRRFGEAGHRDFAPVWLYAAVLPVFLVPWTFLLPRARLPRPIDGATRRAVPAHRLAWAWVVALLLLYSPGRNRLFTYALPIFLPLAVLAGARLATLVDDAGGARRATVGLALAGLAAIAAGALGRFVPVDAWPAVLGAARPDNAPVPWSTAALVLAGGGVLAASSPLWVGALRSATTRLVALAIAAAALWWGLDVAAAQVDALRSPRALAAALDDAAAPGDDIVCVDLLPQGLRFAHPGLVVDVAGKQGEIVEPWATKDGPGRLLSDDELARRWDGPQRVLLVVRARKAQPWIARGARVLATRLAGAQRSDLVVLENRPRRP